MDVNNLIRRVQQQFSDLAPLVQQYKTTKPDAESRSLDWRVSTEETLFDQTLRGLPPWLKSGNQTKRRAGQPGKIVKELGDEIQNMSEVLKALEIELTNTSRGTEVMAKLGRRWASETYSKSTLRQTLDRVTSINTRVSEHARDEPIHLSMASRIPYSRDLRLLFHPQHLQHANALEVRGLYHFKNCDQLSYERARQVGSELDDHPRADLEVDIPQRSRLPPSSNVRSSKRLLSELAEEEILADQSSNLNALGDHYRRDHRYYCAHSHNKDAIYLLVVKESTENKDLAGLHDFLEHPEVQSNKQLRMQFAFRLSVAIVLLWTNQPLMEWQTSGDWEAFFDLTNLSSNSPFSLESLALDHRNKDDETRSPSMFAILNKEPALARLGLWLIELALGQIMMDIREDRNILHEDIEDITEEVHEELENEVLDLLAAKRLIAEGLLRHEVSPQFEAAVIACVEQQYREPKTGKVKDLAFEDPNFVTSITSAVLMPLSHEAYGPELDLSENDVSDLKGRAPSDSNTESVQGLDINGDGVTVKQSEEDHASEALDLVADLSAASLQGRTVETSSQKQFTRPPKPSIAGSGEETKHLPSRLSDTLQSSNSGKTLATLSFAESKVSEAQRSDQGKDQQINVGQGTAHQSSPKLDATEPGKQPKATSQGPRYTNNVLKPGPPVSTSLDPPRGNHRPLRSVYGPLSTFPQQRAVTTLGPVDNDSVAESGYTEDTWNTTSDIVGTWPFQAANHFSSLPKGHPYRELFSGAVRVSNRGYKEWVRQCGSGSNGESESSNLPADLGNSGGAGDSGPNKRRRGQSYAGANDDNAEDEDTDKPEQSPPGGPSKKAKVDDDIFACPYFKMNPAAYLQCSSLRLSRIRDVKQHLRRRHKTPIYCPRCYDTFETEDVRDQHAQDVDCKKRPGAKPEGLSQAQMDQLGSRSSRNESPEKQWFTVYQYLFPKEERPATPWVDRHLFKDATGYWKYQQTHGPRILKEYMTAGGLVEWKFRDPSAEFESLWNGVVEQALQEMVGRFLKGKSLQPDEDLDSVDEPTASSTITKNEDLNPGSTALPIRGDHSEGFPLIENRIASTDGPLVPRSNVPSMASWEAEGSDYGLSNFTFESGSGYNIMTVDDTQEVLNTFHTYSGSEWPPAPSNQSNPYQGL